MADVIKVPVSFGEVLDKITILEIKSERIADAEKVKNVRLELDELSATWNEAVQDQAAIADLRKQLKEVNEALWEIEDDIRDQEAAQDFGAKFIELARAVYVTNDKRAAIKKDVNLALVTICGRKVLSGLHRPQVKRCFHSPGLSHPLPSRERVKEKAGESPRQWLGISAGQPTDPASPSRPPPSPVPSPPRTPPLRPSEPAQPSCR